MRARRAAVVCALVVACSQRARREDASVAAPRDVKAVVDAAAGDAGAAPRPGGMWRDRGVVGDAVSNALACGSPREVFGAVAKPTEDLSQAELRLVRWSDRGAATVATRTVTTGVFPGGPMALLRRGAGFTVVWFPALREADGGVEAHALDAETSGFTGDERPATAAEAEAAARAAAARAPRRRAGIQDLAPPSSSGGASVRAELKGATPAVMLDAVEVTRGADLAGFEPSVGVGDAGDGRRWVAVSRGRCQQARVEVFRVDGEQVTLRGRFLLGTEVGVRWIRVDPARDGAVVTWYQTLIPLRIECIRVPGGATVADHGVRVGVVTAEGAAPPPVPALPEPGARDAAADVSAAASASSPRSP